MIPIKLLKIHLTHQLNYLRCLLESFKQYNITLLTIMWYVVFVHKLVVGLQNTIIRSLVIIATKESLLN